MSRASEWLSRRLQGSSATPREVTDEALTEKISFDELRDAVRELSVQSVEQRPAAGGPPYTVWVLPETAPASPTRSQKPSVSTSVAITEVIPPAPLTPKERVLRAKERLQRKAPRMSRYLAEMAEIASREAEKCPSCGRGMPRSEELRLKAITAVLDRAGVAPAKGIEGDADSGPVLVFPPGTQIAVLANMPDAALTAVRGDQA